MTNARDCFLCIVALAALTITLGKVVAGATSQATYTLPVNPTNGLNPKP